MMNVARGSLAALVLVAFAGFSFAQDSKTNKPVVESKLPQWIVTCSSGNKDGAFRCQMQQTLYVSATNQRILAVTIERRGEVYGATLLLPHGINFSKGVTWAVDDGEKAQLTITNADQNGSYAGFELSKAMLQALSKGTTFKVETTPLSGDNLNIELSLAGFAAALAILERN